MSWDETQQKLLKAAVRIAQGNQSSNDIVVFDEARSILFKELLPYWSGFKVLFWFFNFEDFWRSEFVSTR